MAASSNLMPTSSRARYGVATPVEVGLYLALVMFGLLLWWTSRYRASVVPMLGPWEFSWSWFLGTSAALWWYARGLFATPSPERPPVWRSLLYFVGVVAIYAVLQTRFEYLAQHMFFLNRIQALVLHDIGPILIALSWPGAVLAQGMPTFPRRIMYALTASRLMRLFRQPLVVAVAFVAIMVLWLVPTVHFRAMIDPKLYQAMNWSMVLDGLLFWLLVLDRRPKPPAPISYGARMLMMVAVMMWQTIIGACIALSTLDLYAFYDWCGRIYPSIGAMQDQQLGGLIIWIPPFMMTAMALIVVSYRLLQASSKNTKEITSCI